MKTELIQKIAVTFELVSGAQMSIDAKRLLIADLDNYPEAAVSRALDRCRSECKGRLCLADIVSRIDDGRPGPNEAWSMIPRDEGTTFVWSEEMREAYAAAAPLMHDHVAARMAFIEKYNRALDRARANKTPAKWTASLGTDEAHRFGPLNRAVEDGKITIDQALACLPAVRHPESGVKALMEPENNNGDHLRPDVRAALEESKRRLAEIDKLCADRDRVEK